MAMITTAMSWELSSPEVVDPETMMEAEEAMEVAVGDSEAGVAMGEEVVEVVVVAGLVLHQEEQITESLSQVCNNICQLSRGV